MADKRDTEALREFLKGHSVRGYEVKVPIFGTAVIDDQVTTGPFVYYKVVADEPMSFDKFADEMNVSAEPMTMKRWEERFVAGSTRKFPRMAVDLLERLEEGGEVSQKDVLFRELMDKGCLDIDQNVFCYTFDSRQVEIRVLRKGMAVEIESEDVAGWPGQIVGIEPARKIVLVEQFAPVTFMNTPVSIVPAEIRPGFYSQTVAALGYGVMDAFEEQGKKPPAGTWDKDQREYALKSPMPISKIEKFCAEHYPDQPFCVIHAMMLFILPIDATKAVFRPLPEGKDPSEYLVEYGG